MNSPFLSKDYVALALIKAKYNIFNENFATISELNQFQNFMQQEFNKRDLGIAIAYEVSREDFNIRSGIITISDRCCCDLDTLPTDILNILNDKSLIIEFFISLENKKIETLENIKEKIPKSHKKELKPL